MDFYAYIKCLRICIHLLRHISKSSHIMNLLFTQADFTYTHTHNLIVHVVLT